MTLGRCVQLGEAEYSPAPIPPFLVAALNVYPGFVPSRKVLWIFSQLIHTSDRFSIFRTMRESFSCDLRALKNLWQQSHLPCENWSDRLRILPRDRRVYFQSLNVNRRQSEPYASYSSLNFRMAEFLWLFNHCIIKIPRFLASSIALAFNARATPRLL